MAKPVQGQMSLFAAPRTGREEYFDEQRPIALNSTVEPHDVKRLTASVLRLVERLREGTATGDELAAIAGRRFSARLGEARNNGLIIGWHKELIRAGVYEYRLI